MKKISNDLLFPLINLIVNLSFFLPPDSRIH